MARLWFQRWFPQLADLRLRALAAGIMLMTVAAERAAGAQPPAAKSGDVGGSVTLRNQVVELKLRQRKVEVKLKEVLDEKALIDAKNGDGPRQPLKAARELFELAVPKAVPPTAKTALRTLDLQINDANEDAKLVEEEWRAAMRRKLEFLDEAALQLGPEGGEAANGAGRWFLRDVLALGAMLVAGGLVLTLHERRRWARWKVRAAFSRPARAAVVSALAATLAAVGPGTGRAADTELTRLRDHLNKEVVRIETQVADAEKALDALLERCRIAHATHGLEPVTPEQKERARSVRNAEREMQERYRALMVTVRTTTLLAREAEQLDSDVVDGLKEHTSKLKAHSAQVRGESVQKLIACGLLMLGVVVPLTLARSLRRWALEEQSRKCPRCLDTDTLGVIPSADPADDRMPKIPLVECSNCRYEIRRNYINQNRLCFPTVGIPASGKTHWMVILYDLIKNANVPVAAEVRKIPSREDARFDQLVRQLLYERGRPAPNVLNLPYPLTFHVRDADRFGRSKMLVSLFDYAGELRDLKIDLDPFRRRALLCEGFTFFLDPTQVTPGTGLDIEDQIRTLEEFAADLHAMHGVPTEQRVDLPVAVCISKFDLLVSQNPIGSQAGELVAKLRKTLGREPDPGLIHERSQLCARVMPLMFPGWNVEGTLRNNFGGRFMYFPISSIGLEHAEQGSDDHATSGIAPFGVLEPLLWLLHMHGYAVFR